jgi:YjjI family glycine radical enzyme
MKNPSIFFPFEDLETGLTSQTVEEFKQHIDAVMKAPGLLVDQKYDALKDAAYKTLPYPSVSPKATQWMQDEIICMLSEGPALFHPRYVTPNYGQLLREGFDFLGLEPAQSLYDATTSLLTTYNYVPNRLPVFIGRLDELLEPYIGSVPEDQACSILRSFWMLVDRLHPNAFVHGNLGPRKTGAGQMLLQVDRELKTLTNLTLRYDPQVTPDNFALQAVGNALEITKPYFLNHARMLEDWGEDYVIASCYNAMRPAGGIYTLVRLNLKQLALHHDVSIRTFLDEVIPEATELEVEVVNSRIRRLVEDVQWFEKDIFVQAGLLKRENFSAYAAIYGLTECINILMERSGKPGVRYGHHPEANQLASRISHKFEKEIASLPALYCEGTAGHACFHAQVGISTDRGVTPGCRIPAGDEPDLYTQLMVEAGPQDAVPGGISTILEFDQTAAQNPRAVLDIIQGAFKTGIRNLSVGSCNSEFIRVTGYLVRRADLEARKAEKALRHDSSLLGTEFLINQENTLHRRIRQV